MYAQVHQALLTHRKTFAALDQLPTEITVPQLVGALACLWCWAMDNAPDGIIVSPMEAERAAQWWGERGQLAHALTSAGFLDPIEHGRFKIHDWEEYAGEVILRRALDAQRKRERRAQMAQQLGANMSTTDAQTSAGHPTDGGRTADGRPSRANLTVPNCTVPNRTVPDGTDTTPPTPLKGGVARAHTREAGENLSKAKPTDQDTLTEYLISLGGTETDAAAYWDHYEANGWRVGKTPMKDWRAAARNWLRRTREYATANGAARRNGKEPVMESLKERSRYFQRMLEEIDSEK